MIDLEVFEVLSETSRSLGRCSFARFPAKGDIVEICPILGPPMKYEVVGIEHRAVHESRKRTLATQDDEPECSLFVANGQIIPELL